MISVTRKYEFAASHRLHVPSFSDDQNQETFGKCNNPFGHGHNYEIFVTVRGPVDPDTGRAVDLRVLDELVRDQVVSQFDHRYMNLDVPVFTKTVPTTENLAREISRSLREHWGSAFPGPWPEYEKLRIRETDRNIFETDE